MGRAGGEGLRRYYKAKIEELELQVKEKTHNLRRLEAQRNELNSQGTGQTTVGFGVRASAELRP